ncbi:MAG: hypothetical protein NVS2B16_27310 [Chloroflexota bacterium]
MRGGAGNECAQEVALDMVVLIELAGDTQSLVLIGHQQVDHMEHAPWAMQAAAAGGMKVPRYVPVWASNCLTKLSLSSPT